MSSGGKRKNAGRKPSVNKREIKTLSCSVDVVSYMQVQALAEDAGISMSEWIATAIKHMANKQLSGSF